MIVVRPDAGTLARVRLAPSPASDIASWLRLAAYGGRHPVLGDPGATARFALRDRDVALLALAIGDGGYTPDVLTPVPGAGSWAQILAKQLEQVFHAAGEVTLFQLQAHRPAGWRMPREVCHALDAGSFARRAAQGLRRFYETALADQLAYLDAAAVADVARRGQVFAAHGLGHVLGTLHPRVAWTGSELRLDLPYDETAELTGVELVLVPSILSRRGFGVQLDASGDMYLCYPASGLNTARYRRPPGLTALIGHTRAVVLRDLDVPRTTTELSRRQGLAKSTVSHHLGILLRAGLVARARDGGAVRYRRTEQGDHMAAAN